MLVYTAMSSKDLSMTKYSYSYLLGDNIYGRVSIDNDNEAYRVKIEKVLLCAGQDGYIPAFNPDDKEFGCLVDTDRLMYLSLIHI